MAAKRDFLVVYNYGMGGIWAVIQARSANVILQKYPSLKVETQRPNWMTNDHFDKIAAARTFDIDDPPTGWLLSLPR